ncbi:hypothetical protein AMR74_05535 [Halorubrum tropicale]|jgi:hypothetical protein|uniref:Uncharacterized protein n=1 Tax=Halorubrum tropicale TaxID=1765655 RepID=A0A0N0BRI5_9EURY|nr:hypothetical protein AMR74_05535 [Halorubrum tropicale]
MMGRSPRELLKESRVDRAIDSTAPIPSDEIRTTAATLITELRWRVPASARSEAEAARSTREGRGERSKSANREAGEV